MCAEVMKETHLEIAHVLFMDVVGYSKLLVNEQRGVLQQLNEVVRGAPQFRKSTAAGKLICIPTGDGMALVFFHSPEEPVHCAMEIAKALKNHPHIRLRMGVHSGPVDQVKDVNDRINVAGAGINIAQRVMDCGDAGHILISKRISDDLAQDSFWQPLLHELGEVEVKHGAKVGIVNLYTAELGNPHPPERLSGDKATSVSSFASVQAPPTPGKSIAVLAFVNMSSDPDNEYFSDGIAEEIINTLTRVKALRVASRTSSFAFKGKNQDIGEIGHKLKVSTILEGSVRKAGDRLRVTAQLIDVTNGYHLWSERYDRQLEHVFEIQDEIAENIVRALRVVLGEEEKRAIEQTAPTEDVQAYEYYLRGRQMQHQMRRTTLQHARRMFGRAIEIDPNFARAHAGIADCCSILYMYRDASRANLEGADASSQKALELDPESAEAHTSRALALTLRRRYQEAREEFEAALRLNPMLFEAHYFYARACQTESKFEEAVAHYRDAWRVRSDDYQAIFLSVQALMKLGRRDEASEAARQALRLADAHLELNPDDARAWMHSAGALMYLGHREQALERTRRAYAIDPEDAGILYNMACAHAEAGLNAEALDYLDKAIRNGFARRDWLENDSSLDSIRGEPQFQALLQKL